VQPDPEKDHHAAGKHRQQPPAYSCVECEISRISDMEEIINDLSFGPWAIFYLRLNFLQFLQLLRQAYCCSIV